MTSNEEEKTTFLSDPQDLQNTRNEKHDNSTTLVPKQIPAQEDTFHLKISEINGKQTCTD